MFASIAVTGIGDTVAEDGVVTLREAIASVNAGAAVNVDVAPTGGAFGSDDAITFAIAGTGVQTIAPTNKLPDLQKRVTIDGFSQPGSKPNALAVGDDSVHLIELNGANAGFVTSGLAVFAPGTVIRGLVINEFRQLPGGGGDGIGVPFQGAEGTRIEGNFIGTDATGTVAKPNEGNGVAFGGPVVVGGGASPAARNVIAGNQDDGLVAAADGGIVLGNYLGTNATGTAALPNRYGVRVQSGATDVTIGGDAPGAGNLISGNAADGVVVQAGTDDVRSFNNTIGVNAAGNAVLGNGENGIQTTVVGTLTVRGNVVGGNALDGVRLAGEAAGNWTVRGNFIGTNAAGDTLGNGGDGVDALTAPDKGWQILVGGTAPGEGNTIRFNGGDGITYASTGATVRALSNSLFANGGLGIDRNNDGPSVNDPSANPTVTNAPVLSAATAGPATTNVAGSFHGKANAQYRVQLFNSPQADAAGSGEGRTFVSDVTVTTNAQGDAAIAADLPMVIPFGQILTATATPIAAGSTGEFSNSLAVAGPPPKLSIGNVTLTEGNSGTTFADFTVSLSSSLGQPVAVSYATADGSASGLSDYVPQANVLNFLPGETSKTISIAVNSDLAAELDETFAVNLISVTSGNAVIDDGQGVGTIVNDDAALPSQPATLSVNDPSVNEGNSGTKTLTFTVTRTGDASGVSTVKYATQNGSAGDGDYTGKSGTLTFAAGQTTKTVDIHVKGDTKVEADETFTIKLSQPSAGTGISDDKGTGTIKNDDGNGGGNPQPGNVKLDIHNVSEHEGKSGTRAFTFKVTLDKASNQTVTVKYATANGSAGSGDYNAAGGTLTFAPGQTQKTITVHVKGDTKVECDETFFVNLSSAVNAAINKGKGTGTIKNDD